MLRNTPKTILWLLALLFAVTGCQQEDIQYPEEPNVMGRIVLALSEPEVYIETRSASATTLSNFKGFVFTLNGKTDKNVDVNDEVTFTASTDENNNPIAVGYFDAGTYKLTVSSQTASLKDNGCAYYEKTTEKSFHFDAGETIKLTIEMGAPLNAKVTLVLDQSFTDLYTFAKADNESELKTKYESQYNKEPGLKIHTHNNTTSRTLDLAQAWYDHSQDNSNDEAVYFPVDEGVIDYVIYAAAKPGTPEKPGSYITDIVGVSGSISPQAGKHYVITLKANTVSGEIIPIIEGTHNDYFD